MTVRYQISSNLSTSEWQMELRLDFQKGGFRVTPAFTHQCPASPSVLFPQISCILSLLYTGAALYTGFVLKEFVEGFFFLKSCGIKNTTTGWHQWHFKQKNLSLIHVIHQSLWSWIKNSAKSRRTQGIEIQSQFLVLPLSEFKNKFHISGFQQQLLKLYYARMSLKRKRHLNRKPQVFKM